MSTFILFENLRIAWRKKKEDKLKEGVGENKIKQDGENGRGNGVSTTRLEKEVKCQMEMSGVYPRFVLLSLILK